MQCNTINNPEKSIINLNKLVSHFSSYVTLSKFASGYTPPVGPGM